MRGEATIQDTLVEPESFYVENDVDVLLETAVPDGCQRRTRSRDRERATPPLPKALDRQRRPASAPGQPGSGGYDTASTFFTEIFGLALKLFGDLSEHDQLIVRGSLADRNLLGFYLGRARIVATLVVGQEKETEVALQRLIKDRALIDSKHLADQSSSDLHDLFNSTAEDLPIQPR